MIIARYITKEILWSLFGILGILLLIAISNRFAVYLAKAATGELPISLVFRLVLLYIPELTSYVAPLSFFVAILFVCGRLYVDSEMTILSACGFGTSYMTKLILSIGLFLTLGMSVLTFWLIPKVSILLEQALSEREALVVIQSMLPGRFQTAGEGKLIFYLEDVSPQENTLKEVFIAEQPIPATKSKNGWTFITAKEAHIKREALTNDFYLVLKHGYRYQGSPGKADYSVVKFNEYGRMVQQLSSYSNEELQLKSTSTLGLLKTSNLEQRAEFQWRVSLPLSVIVLGLLAFPLSHVKPRHGRFAKLLPAVILYIIYYNLFTISKRWVAAGTLPVSIGVWWVHALFLLLALGLLIKEAGVIRQYRYYSREAQLKKPQLKKPQLKIPHEY